MSQFLGSLGLGFSTSLSCAITCLPLYLSFGLSDDGGRDLRRLLMLLCGRLAAYLLVGALAGALGNAVPTALAGKLSAAAIIPLAVLLFLRASGAFAREISFCGLLSRVGERIRSPLIAGFLMGFSVCYPFLIAIAVAASTGGPLGGMVVFCGFFVGTSAFLAPLLLLPLLRGRAFREWLGRASPAVAALLALFYLARALIILAPPGAAPATATEEDVRKLFPGATAIEHVPDASPPYYRISSGPEGNRVLAGYAVESMECAPEIRGYAGPIPLLVAVDPAGVVRGVAVLANRETPSYVARVLSAPYLEHFVGRSSRDPLEIGRDVDAVSGATVSLEAMTGSLRATLGLFSTRILHLEPLSPAAAAPEGLGYRIPVFLVMAGLSVGALVAGPRWRPWFLLSSVAVLGVATHTFASISDVVRLLFGFPFAAGEAAGRAVLIGSALLSTVLLGRHYCSLLCPYGALQELIYTVSPIKRSLSAGLDRTLRAGKYLLLLGLPFLFAFLRDFGVLAFEPFDPTFRALVSPAFARELAATGLPLLLLLALLLAANLVTERFFCKYLCPLGALFALLATARILGRRRLAAGRCCTGCSKGLPDFPAECFGCGGRRP